MSAAPFHAHIYFTAEQRTMAEALREAFLLQMGSGSAFPLLFVGEMMDRAVGPHSLPQFEIHFLERSIEGVVTLIEASGLRALVHPLTDDDIADHTISARWIGAPVDLDLTVLDPPGLNKGVSRFGKSDFA